MSEPKRLAAAICYAEQAVFEFQVFHARTRWYRLWHREPNALTAKAFYILSEFANSKADIEALRLTLPIAKGRLENEYLSTVEVMDA